MDIDFILYIEAKNIFIEIVKFPFHQYQQDYCDFCQTLVLSDLVIEESGGYKTNNR